MAACWRPHASDTIRAVPRTIAPVEIKPDLTFNALSLVGCSGLMGLRSGQQSSGPQGTGGSRFLIETRVFTHPARHRDDVTALFESNRTDAASTISMLAA